MKSNIDIGPSAKNVSLRKHEETIGMSTYWFCFFELTKTNSFRISLKYDGGFSIKHF